MEEIQLITLASASPRRRDILSDAGLRFEVMPADVEEFEDTQAEPSALVHYNALIKAEAIAQQRPDALILAADTTVFHRQHVLSKPRDMREAREMLKRLSGETHTVYTGVALMCLARGIQDVFVDTSDVCFKALDDDTITQYFSVVNPLDKAGAYGIQDGRELIIESYSGSLENIMGLPVGSVIEHLERYGLLDAVKV